MNKVSKRVFFPRAWEVVDDQGTNRLKVFGGWLVWSCYNRDSECICFMSDPQHKWELVPLKTVKKESVNA